MADTPQTLEPRRTESDLVVSAADLLAGRVSPDEAIVLLDRLLTGTHGEPPAHPEPDPTDCLLWHAPPVVMQLWPDRWVTRSAALSRILGHSPDSSYHREPLTFVHPPDRGTAMRAYVETVTGRSARRAVPLRVRAADGGLRLFETTFVRADTATGHPSVVVYAEDVTGWYADRVRLGELARQQNHGVMVVDEAGYVTLANDALTRVFGPRTGDWVGRPEAEALRWLVTSCRDVAWADQQVAAVAAAPEYRALRLPLADGRTVHIDRSPVTGADLDHGALWRFWDVTAPAREPNTDRNTRTRVRGREPRILATVSHELGSIMRVAEMHADPRTRLTRKDRRTAAKAIACDARRLLAVVDDLLLLARLDNGELALRGSQARVPDLVRAAVTGRAAEAKAAGVALSCRIGRGPSVAGDAALLRRALDGLIRDTVRFSAKGGTVTVSARSSGTEWTIQVISRPKGNPGNGLGLVVCQRLVELHHGDLTVESTVDVGTTVCVRIPGRGRAL